MTPAFGWIFIVQYSPDNSKIAIMAWKPKGTWKVYWVSAEGGSLHEVPAPIAVQADPVWSSDSQSIMFGLPPENFGGGAPDVVRHLYWYDLRTVKTTEVPGSEGLFSPRSAPNGRYIAAMNADLQGLSVLDITTSKWRPLTRQQSTSYPFWSPDSEWVYFNDIGDRGLWRVRVSDGHVEELGRIPRPQVTTTVMLNPSLRMEQRCWDVLTRGWTFSRWITKSRNERSPDGPGFVDDASIVDSLSVDFHDLPTGLYDLAFHLASQEGACEIRVRQLGRRQDVVITTAVEDQLGLRFLGALAVLRKDDQPRLILQQVVESNCIPPQAFDEVVSGGQRLAVHYEREWHVKAGAGLLRVECSCGDGQQGHQNHRLVNCGFHDGSPLPGWAD